MASKIERIEEGKGKFIRRKKNNKSDAKIKSKYAF